VAGFRPTIPPRVAEVIRHLPPDLKRSVKHALRAISTDPHCGEPLQKELEGYWDRAGRFIRIVAVGHRRIIYEVVAEQIRRKP
jgi:mRNA interferase RelE/StbE